MRGCIFANGMLAPLFLLREYRNILCKTSDSLSYSFSHNDTYCFTKYCSHGDSHCKTYSLLPPEYSVRRGAFQLLQLPTWEIHRLQPSSLRRLPRRHVLLKLKLERLSEVLGGSVFGSRIVCMLGAMPRRSGAYGYRRALQVLRRREICLQPDVCIMHARNIQLRQSC